MAIEAASWTSEPARTDRPRDFEMNGGSGVSIAEAPSADGWEKLIQCGWGHVGHVGDEQRV